MENKSNEQISSFLSEMAAKILSDFPREWLAFLELFELSCSRTNRTLPSLWWYEEVKSNLEKLFKNTDKEWLIAQGMGLLYTLD